MHARAFGSRDLNRAQPVQQRDFGRAAIAACCRLNARASRVSASEGVDSTTALRWLD